MPCWSSPKNSCDVMSALTFGEATSLCKNNFCVTPWCRSQFLYFVLFSMKPFLSRSCSTQSNLVFFVESQTKSIDDMHSKKAKKRQTTSITQKVIPGTNRVAKCYHRAPNLLEVDLEDEKSCQAKSFRHQSAINLPFVGCTHCGNLHDGELNAKSQSRTCKDWPH